MSYTEIESKVQEGAKNRDEDEENKVKIEGVPPIGRCETPSQKNKLKDKSSRKQGYVAGNHEEVQGCELRGKENLE